MYKLSGIHISYTSSARMRLPPLLSRSLLVLFYLAAALFLIPYLVPFNCFVAGSPSSSHTFSSRALSALTPFCLLSFSLSCHSLSLGVVASLADPSTHLIVPMPFVLQMLLFLPTVFYCCQFLLHKLFSHAPFSSPLAFATVTGRNGAERMWPVSWFLFFILPLCVSLPVLPLHSYFSNGLCKRDVGLTKSEIFRGFSWSQLFCFLL